MDRLEQTINISQVNKQSFALLYIDLDGFKPINDTYGHAVGDEYLRISAARWQSLLPPTATLGRLGGDEFALISPCINTPEAALELADLLLQQTQQAVTLPDCPPLTASISIGIAIYPQHGRTADQLLDCADRAMYCAKKNKGRVCLFSQCPHARNNLLENFPYQNNVQQPESLTATLS